MSSLLGGEILLPSESGEDPSELLSLLRAECKQMSTTYHTATESLLATTRNIQQTQIIRNYSTNFEVSPQRAVDSVVELDYRMYSSTYIVFQNFG